MLNLLICDSVAKGEQALKIAPFGETIGKKSPTYEKIMSQSTACSLRLITKITIFLGSYSIAILCTNLAGRIAEYYENGY